MKNIMLPILYFVCALCFLAPFSDAQAQSSSIPDKFVKAAMKEMRPYLAKMKISKTEVIGKETREELSDPLLTLDEAREALSYGIVSGIAKSCRIDWKENNYKPFMIAQKKAGKTPKQLAYIRLLHKYTFKLTGAIYKDRRCNKESKQHTRSRFYKE